MEMVFLMEMVFSPEKGVPLLLAGLIQKACLLGMADQQSWMGVLFPQFVSHSVMVVSAGVGQP